MTGDDRIDVCVCTFRRASLWATLESLAAQTFRSRMRVIVADNDEAASAEALAARARSEFSLDLLYLRAAPAQNISVARNACLDAATAPVVAFIDDDETAAPDWLAKLQETLRAAELDVVFGPVKALYAPDAPAWLVKGDFMSLKPVIRADGLIHTGYTSNVLFRRSACGGVRFDPAFGRSGGGDTYFFAALHRQGARLGYCEEAVVMEPVAPSRANLRWRLRRAFRSGQVHARLERERGQGPLRIAAVATAKAAYCGLAALASAAFQGLCTSMAKGAEVGEMA